MRNPPTVTDACTAKRWGDPNGHHKRNETLCPRCSALANGRTRAWKLLAGKSRMAFSRDELLVFVRAFNAGWDPSYGTAAADHALRFAVETTIQEGIK